MSERSVVVLDVGKTLAKATLWSSSRQMLQRRSRPNERIIEDGRPALDYAGIERWLAETLADFAREADIATIVPVAHGASACIVRGDALAVPPLDYEAELPPDVRDGYCAIRDSFANTGSPRLPAGLNLGAQLFWLQRARPTEFARGRILTWPQYWAWRLCGVESVEVTSLGCHTDLWCPATNRPSAMAAAQGWAARFASLRKASDVLGKITAAWRDRTGLPGNCKVLCGIHDSNAALLASRLHPEIENRECTVLSTGTWFIAMRSLASAADSPTLHEERDCLFNVDVAGNPVPSSRFMGGRETELLEENHGPPLDVVSHGAELLSRAEQMVEDGVFALPAFEKGVGPYPKAVGRWIKRPEDRISRRAVAGLYLALMADSALSLIGARERIVIEGRFAADPVFTRALRSLRHGDSIYLSQAQDSLGLGALALLDGAIPQAAQLTAVEPLDFDLNDYANRWREMAEQGERT